jgi:hypothetical protein
MLSNCRRALVRPSSDARDSGRSLPLSRMLRPCEHCDVPNLRYPLFKQLDAFTHEIECQITYARKISAWPGEAFYEFSVHRVAADPEYDGSCGVERLHRPYRQLLRDDHLGIGRGQCVRHGIHVLLPCRPVHTDRQIAALDPSALAQSGAQRI